MANKFKQIIDIYKKINILISHHNKNRKWKKFVWIQWFHFLDIVRKDYVILKIGRGLQMRIRFMYMDGYSKILSSVVGQYKKGKLMVLSSNIIGWRMKFMCQILLKGQSIPYVTSAIIWNGRNDFSPFFLI